MISTVSAKLRRFGPTNSPFGIGVPAKHVNERHMAVQNHQTAAGSHEVIKPISKFTTLLLITEQALST